MRAAVASKRFFAPRLEKRAEQKPFARVATFPAEAEGLDHFLVRGARSVQYCTVPSIFLFFFSSTIGGRCRHATV